GSSVTTGNAAGMYTAATLGVGAGNTYRIGGGTGTLWLNGFTGTTGVLAGTASVQFGAVNNGAAAASLAMTNGGGTVLVNTPNSFTGGATIHARPTVAMGNLLALGA